MFLSPTAKLGTKSSPLKSRLATTIPSSRGGAVVGSGRLTMDYAWELGQVPEDRGEHRRQCSAKRAGRLAEPRPGGPSIQPIISLRASFCEMLSSSSKAPRL